MRQDGLRPLSSRISNSMLAVVVFPWVPATATVRKECDRSATSLARDTVPIPRCRAAASSGLSLGTAAEWITRATPSPTASALCPVITATPSASRIVQCLGRLPVRSADPAAEMHQQPRQTLPCPHRRHRPDGHGLLSLPRPASVDRSVSSQRYRPAPATTGIPGGGCAVLNGRSLRSIPPNQGSLFAGDER